MTTRTWNGTTGNYTDAGSWSPTGVPTSGDTAIISSGTVNTSGPISGVAIQLNEVAGATASANLALNSAALDSATSLAVINAQGFTTKPPALISVTGTSSFAGTGSFYGSLIEFNIGTGSTLVNTGTMNFYSSSPAAVGGTLQNSGTIAIVNPGNGVQVSNLASAVTGTGTIALGEHGRLEFDGPVGSGQTIVFNDGSAGNELLQFNNAGAVSATLNGFSVSDTLIVNTNSAYTGYNYVAGANSGTLQLLSGGTAFASLNLQGQYSQGSFAITSQPVGNGTSNLTITTSANNAVSAGLPPGYQNGGSGIALPVYRFFDTVYGTHLFTQSAGEAQQILATRPDLTQETNGFGAVSQTGPGAEAVYRFFETSNGTHFFTANYNEYLGLVTPGTATYRSDLTAEPTSTFYEDSTQQAGDVPVYRLFDTVHGTQFLTGDQNEYNGLTTAGSSTYRADLHSEGVAFYAPTGTFKA